MFRAVVDQLLGLRDWLLPPACPLCGLLLNAGDSVGLCRACLDGFPAIASPRCPRCFLPYPALGGPDHECGACLGDPPPFAVLGVVGSHAEQLRTAIHRFKYRQGLALARPLARCLETAAAAAVQAFAPDALMPVPLHRQRLRERGYNQSLLLARELARSWRLPLLPRHLQRRLATPSQQGLDAAARRRNLRQAFVVPEPVPLQRVLLIDDVMTTGATLRACSETLLRSGVGQVGALVLARAAGD